MNKHLAKNGSTLNKNMTNIESLQLNDLTVTTNLVIPIYKTTDVPSRPQNPIQHSWCVEYNVVANTFTNKYYIDGNWLP